MRIERDLSRLHEPYDVIVVGGGITGVCVAREAAGRGLRTLLVEKGDFGGGTSSATSKYLHGGMRAGGKESFLMIAPGVDTIDASAARTDFMGHAYFDNSVNIITDIQKMFATAASPEARRLIPGFLRNLKYWIMPATDRRDVQIH